MRMQNGMQIETENMQPCDEMKEKVRK